MYMDGDRFLEFKIRGRDIRTCTWDFGCDILFNDFIICLDKISETDSKEKLTLSFCLDIICRLLRNTDLISTDISKISEESIALSFLRFKKWFKEDLDYFSNCLTLANPYKIKTSDSEPIDFANNLLYIAYQLSDAYHRPISEICNLNIEDVAHYMMFKEMEAVKRYQSEKGTESVF